MNIKKRHIGVLAILGALLLIAAASVAIQSAAKAVSTVSFDGVTKQLTGTNVTRTTNALVLYTSAYGATTKTNQYGAEAVVIDGKVTELINGVGSQAIPPNGAVVSGHGTARTWLLTYAKVGAEVVYDAPNPPPSGIPLYPDMTVRTLRQFTIVTVGAKKLLKFPGVTANTGAGPFEVLATRPNTSSPWTAKQTIFYSNGSKQTIPNNLVFYYAGDGHSHWHMLDFDAYNLYNAAGTILETGEKHGFCFEDNTSYRNWPGNPNYPAAPAVPVYTHDNACGVLQPNALSITHGLSVGWADTYPASLPDQAIDITGLPNGDYKVEVVADQAHLLKEMSESNNASWATIRITGNTVTILATGGGS